MPEHTAAIHPVCLWGFVTGGKGSLEGIAIVHHATPIWLLLRSGSETMQPGLRLFSTCAFKLSDSVLGPLSGPMRASQRNIISSIEKADPLLAHGLFSLPQSGQGVFFHAAYEDPIFAGEVQEVFPHASSLQMELQNYVGVLESIQSDLREQMRNNFKTEEEEFKKLLDRICALEALIPFAKGQRFFLRREEELREIYAITSQNKIFVLPAAVAQNWASATSTSRTIVCAVNPEVRGKREDGSPKFLITTLGTNGVRFGAIGEFCLEEFILSDRRTISLAEFVNEGWTLEVTKGEEKPQTPTPTLLLHPAPI